MLKTTSNIKDYSRLENWLNIVSSDKTASKLKTITPILNSQNDTFFIKNVDSKPMTDLKGMQD